MKTNEFELGIVGLGKIGGNLAFQALGKGMHVVGLTKGEPPEELLKKGLIKADSAKGFLDHLNPPRMVFIYIPAGPAIDTLIDELTDVLEKGDILIDGGNSYWGDSIRRY
ncbi:MAG: NAD(P)-binding domain-containing protein [Bacteroidales bacterium]